MAGGRKLGLAPAAALTLLTTLAPAPPAAAQENAAPWLLSVAESVDCLRGVDANPLFAAVKVRMPSAESMGLAHIDDRAKPNGREQEIK